MQDKVAPPDIEKVTMRKVTLRIVPFLMLLYFVAYLDRVNVGFAKITMNSDIGLSDAAFGFGAGIFFLGYFIFEVPSNLILHKVGARRWIARIMLSWGIVSACMALATGPVSFAVLRFLLGVAEAGFFPGVILYLGYWFPSRHRARIVALFMAAVPISVAIGSPVSGLLLKLDGLMGLHGWQWLFIVEAAPAILLSGVVLKYLTDRPEKADWLSQEQRSWLAEEMNREAENKPAGHSSFAALRALVNPRILSLAVIYFGTSAGLYTLGIWAPDMIASQGVDTLTTGFINAIPPIAAVICMVLWARHSDRTGERNWHVFIACVVAASGLAMAAFASSLVPVVVALVIVNIGISSAKPPLWAIPTTFLTGASAAAGIAAVNSIGNLGGFAGPYLIGWIKETTGSFEGGLIAVSAMLVLSAILILFQPKAHNAPQSPRARNT
jgi:MFS transporter, ACS family, tartrate transporter